MKPDFEKARAIVAATTFPSYEDDQWMKAFVNDLRARFLGLRDVRDKLQSFAFRALESNSTVSPTYYVKHADGGFSVAIPQPVAAPIEGNSSSGQSVIEILDEQKRIIAALESEIEEWRKLRAFELQYGAIETTLEEKSIKITNEMAYAFHRAIGDHTLSHTDVEETKTGLAAAFAHISAPKLEPEQPAGLAATTRINNLEHALRLVMSCAGDIDAATDGELEAALECGDPETERQAKAWMVARAALVATEPTQKLEAEAQPVSEGWLCEYAMHGGRYQTVFTLDKPDSVLALNKREVFSGAAPKADRDGERLSWLAENCKHRALQGNPTWTWIISSDVPYLRDVIDAAMAAEGEK
jgi:hypothetical protein